MKTPFFSNKFFQFYKSPNEVKIPPIVDMNTPDGTNGTENKLQETGIRLCQEIAEIEGLPQDFVAKVNGEAMSIKSVAFGDNYHGYMLNPRVFDIHQKHRVIVCNALNEINTLLREFQANPEKYSFNDVSIATLGYTGALANCSVGRENAVKTLSEYLQDWKIAKDLAAEKGQDANEEVLQELEQAKLRTFIQKAKENLIYAKIDTIDPDTHAVQRMKHLVYGEYGLPYANNDSLNCFSRYQEERKQLREYTASEKFFQNLISSVASGRIANKPRQGKNESQSYLEEKIIKPNDLRLIYKTGDFTEWNANINHVVKLHYIRQMLPLGIFSDETQKKLSTLTSPKLMRLLLVLGQNVHSAEEKEDFVQNEVTYEYEKPNSSYQLPEFYSYNELIKHLSDNKDNIEHFKHDTALQKLLAEVIAEQNSKLNVVLNLDSYQVTRLAHIIAKGERKNESVEYRKFDELLKTPLVKNKLLEIAEEVKRIEEKNGFTRTLEQCFYAVCDFFRNIFRYSSLDRETKRDSETFLYATEGAVKEDGAAPEKKAGSFVALMGLQQDAEPEVGEVAPL